MAVIDQYRSLLTVLTVLNVNPDIMDECLANLKEFYKETVKLQTGFVSANLHISIDRKTIVNYEQWRTQVDYQNFQANEELQAKLQLALKGEFSKTLMTVALAT